MKPILKLLLVAFLLTFSVSCSTDSFDDLEATNQNIIIPEAKTIEIEIMELINTHRISLGLNALNDNSMIKGQAYSHSDYMVINNNVSHDNFFQRKNYLMNNDGAQVVSENVAYGYTSAQSVVNAWLNSEGHRDNLEGDFTEFDISAEQNEQGKWYFTNIFIKK